MVRELSLKQVLQRGLPGHPLEAVNLRLYHDAWSRDRAPSQAN